MTVMTAPLPSFGRRVPASSLVVGLVVALLMAYIVTEWRSPDVAPTPVAAAAVPQSSGLEAATGVRFSRVAVVGDGGLVMVEYVVLDAEKATAFRADLQHVPVLTSEARAAGTRRVSIMKPGHLIRAGQTYYFVYENTGAALRPGETVAITYRGHALRDVPVL